MFKKVIAATALTVALITPGCLGPNNATNSVLNWNAEATEPDWLNELIFIGCNLIPVYPLLWLGDTFIFNTIGYWGTNPIDDPGEFPSSFGSDE